MVKYHLMVIAQFSRIAVALADFASPEVRAVGAHSVRRPSSADVFCTRSSEISTSGRTLLEQALKSG